MHIEKQFSIFMVNKPGVLAQVLGEFARARINIIALTVMDSAEHGVLRVVTAASANTKKVLDHLNMQHSETDVLCINLSNRPGALAEIAEKLAKSHINISYAYCTAGAKGGRTTGIVKVADVQKAMRLLQDTASREPKSKPTIRAPSFRR